MEKLFEQIGRVRSDRAIFNTNIFFYGLSVVFFPIFDFALFVHIASVMY